MANHKSALKRHRQSLKRNTRNRSLKSEIWTLTKKVTSAPKTEAVALMQQLQSILAKAGRKGVLHKKTASKHISHMMKTISSK